MTRYTDCIVFLLAKAYQKSQKNLKKRLRPFGLTSVQALVLELLFEEEGLTTGEISKRLKLDNATVSGVLERLTEAEWIHKRSDRADRRITRIHLAPKSIELEATLLEERTRANEEILGKFLPEERILLKRFLRDFL